MTTINKCSISDSFYISYHRRRQCYVKKKIEYQVQEQSRIRIRTGIWESSIRVALQPKFNAYLCFKSSINHCQFDFRYTSVIIQWRAKKIKTLIFFLFSNAISTVVPLNFLSSASRLLQSDNHTISVLRSFISF